MMMRLKGVVGRGSEEIRGGEFEGTWVLIK
jgi:hypothetical protein